MNLRGVIGGISAAAMLVIGALLANEGGHVNHPSDPGGETNRGITKRVAVEQGYTGPMKALPEAVAIVIYNAEYIVKPGFLPIVDREVALGTEIVDTGANAGPGRAARWLQESLNHFNERGRAYPDIAEDGRVGPGTIAAYDALAKRRGAKLACELVLKSIDAKQAQHYMRLAAKNSKFEDFMAGWFRTRISNVDYRTCGRKVTAAPPAKEGWRPGS